LKILYYFLVLIDVLTEKIISGSVKLQDIQFEFKSSFFHIYRNLYCVGGDVKHCSMQSNQIICADSIPFESDSPIQKFLYFMHCLAAISVIPFPHLHECVSGNPCVGCYNMRVHVFQL